MIGIGRAESADRESVVAALDASVKPIRLASNVVRIFIMVESPKSNVML
jgi:hypothetical protein